MPLVHTWYDFMCVCMHGGRWKCPAPVLSPHFLVRVERGDCYLSLSLNSLSLGPLLDTCKVNPANPPTFSTSFFSLYPLLFHVPVLLSIVGQMPQIGRIDTKSIPALFPVTYPLACLSSLLLVHQILPPLAHPSSVSPFSSCYCYSLPSLAHSTPTWEHIQFAGTKLKGDDMNLISPPL